MSITLGNLIQNLVQRRVVYAIIRYTYFSKIYSKITLTKFQLAINIAADQLFIKSKISPAVKGATAIVVKSIVLKTALILANLSSFFRETTTIQSFSRIIFDPIEAIWPMSAKIMVKIGTKVGIHVGQDDSPTWWKK